MNSPVKKTIFFVGGGLETVPGLQVAKEMGLHVVVSDMNPQAPAFEYADDVIVANTYDVDETVAKARNYSERVRSIDGVICQAVDVPLTVASVAKALGISGISLESAYLASDKLAMKIRLQQDGISIPWFSRVESLEYLLQLIAENGNDLVLKPVDSRGARGVQRLISMQGRSEIEQAFHYTHSFSPTGRVMVEAYLDGPQLSTESLVVNGIAHTVGYSDRNYELCEQYAPFFIENGGDFPTALPDKICHAVDQLIQQAVESMGIQNGVVKGDIVIHEGVPHVIEIAARLSGGYFCSHQIPMGVGIDLVELAIRQALGEVIDIEQLQPKFSRHIVQRYFFPESGKVISIQGVNEVRERPEVLFLEMRVRVGDKIAPVENHPGRAGLVFATGDSHAEAVKHAEDAVASIDIGVAC